MNLNTNELSLVYVALVAYKKTTQAAEQEEKINNTLTRIKQWWHSDEIGPENEPEQDVPVNTFEDLRRRVVTLEQEINAAPKPDAVKQDAAVLASEMLLLDGFKSVIERIVGDKLELMEDLSEGQRREVEHLIDNADDSESLTRGQECEVKDLIDEKIEDFKRDHTTEVSAQDLVSLIENDMDVQTAIKDFITQNVTVDLS